MEGKAIFSTGKLAPETLTSDAGRRFGHVA
jgi:hypothetical protein